MSLPHTQAGGPPLYEAHPQGAEGKQPWGHAEASETVHLKDVLAVIRRHLVLVFGLTAAAMAVTAYLAYIRPPQFRATALLRLIDTQRQLTGGLSDDFVQQQLGRSVDPLLSQLQVLNGREVLGQVVDSEGLRLQSPTRGFSRAALQGVKVSTAAERTDTLELEAGAAGVVVRASGQPAVRARYGTPVRVRGVEFTPTRATGVTRATLVVYPREAAIDALAGRLETQPRDKTDAVEVRYVATDPRTAQQVVNAVLHAFQAENAREAQDQSRRRRVFLENQLRGADSLLVAAQLDLSDFQRREEVFSSQTKFASRQQSLLALQMQRDSLASARGMYATMLQGLNGPPAQRQRMLQALASSPGMASNPVVSQLYAELRQYQRSRDSLTAGTTGATANNPDVQRLAGLVAGTESQLIQAMRSHVSALDAQLAGLAGLEQRSAGDLRALPPTAAEEVRLVQRVESLRKVGDQLRDELEKARVAEAVESGQVEVVYPAPLPTAPIGTGKGLQLALGMVIGLIVGGLAAFFREHMNTAILRKEDLEHLEVPNLAVIPQLEGAFGRPRRVWLPIPLFGANGNGRGAAPIAAGAELVTVSAPQSSAAEAYRSLRTNLIFSHAVRELKTLVVTSSAPAEGKTLTSCNLAVAFAQQGIRVLLVDADLRKARVHRVFGVEREPGLTELVLGYRTAAETVKPTNVAGLSVLPSGTLPPNPSELLGGVRMRATISALREQYDLVIFDTAPTLAASDAAVLSAGVDGVIMVVRAGQTEPGAAFDALQQLLSVGGHVVGSVLNDPDAKVARYGGYYYNYGYTTEKV